MRDWTVRLLVVAALATAGCGWLRVSDEQIEQISTTAGSVAGKVAETASSPLGPGAGAGIGAAATLAIAAGVRALLKGFQKKDCQNGAD